MTCLFKRLAQNADVVGPRPCLSTLTSVMTNHSHVVDLLSSVFSFTSRISSTRPDVGLRISAGFLLCPHVRLPQSEYSTPQHVCDLSSALALRYVLTSVELPFKFSFIFSPAGQHYTPALTPHNAESALCVAVLRKYALR